MNDKGSSKQSECSTGRYSGSGAVECEKCPAGSYTDSKGQSSCSLADAGKYVEDNGASEQDSCPTGKYDQIIPEIIQEAVDDEAPALPAAWHAASSPAA